jgi:cation-transporting ATPase I
MLGGLAQSTRLLRAGVDAVRATAAVTHSAVLLPAAGVSAALSVAPALREAPRRVLSTAVGQAGHLALKVAAAPDRMVATATAVTRGGVSLAEKIRREAEPAARALTDLHPDRSRRRVWAEHGRAHIEVRGMTGSGPKHRRVAAGVTRRLRKLQGVRWAEVNAVTGQVLVAFDERRVNVGTLLEMVRGIEEAQGTREENFSWSRPVHPADSTPIAAAGVELAADCVSVATALGGRILRLPRAPRALRVAQALLEIERPLRKRLKRRVGPIGTDVVLALTAAAIQGLSQSPFAPAVDALYRLELLAEAVSRRAVWERREDELCCAHWALLTEAPERPPRPVPRPNGPIEEWAERLGPGAVFAAGAVLGLTRNPGRAAEAILVAVPKAARLGREGFATTVGRDLAGRGVVPLNAAAWRRLDRVSAIVIDSRVLCTDRAQILDVVPAGDRAVAPVWGAAGRALSGLSMQELAGAGPWRRDEFRLEREGPGDEPGVIRLALRQGTERIGRVDVGSELNQLADALVDAARSARARVLLTRHASVAELVPRVDDVLADDRPLADHVQRLQRDGDSVLVVSDTDDQALAVADVGVAVLGGEACVCWSADVLCGQVRRADGSSDGPPSPATDIGLENVWRVLRATAAAGPVSERAVRLAQAGSALGELLALVGGRRGGPTHALTPVYGAALLALAHGTVAGLSATRGQVPAPVTHVQWHAMDPLEVLARLDSSRAEQDGAPDPGWLHTTVGRVRRVGAGTGVVRPARVAFRLAGAVREELRDPLTPVLAVGAAASAVVGSVIDSILVAAVMGGNALISGAQRVGAERALRQLFLEQEISARRLQRTRGDTASVETVAGLDAVPLADVPATALRPGDIIALRASDVVPADARLLSAVDLEIDESTLTGESLPTQKRVDAVPAAPLPERACMVFEGTTVLAGTAYAVVVATGESTQAGRAASAMGRAAPPAGLQAQLAKLTRTALPATGIGGAAVAGLGLLRGIPLRQAVAAGVSVAVAAVPEGLPLVATVAQAGAARRLSRRGVLVRSSRTLEALGRIDVVCFDKTGTLTEGRLSMTRLASADADLDEADPFARRLLTAAARACPAVSSEQIDTVPHATDRAVLEAAKKLSDVDHRNGWRLRAELPFETNRGYALALGDADGGPLLVVKGAPEVVLPLCGSVAGPESGAEALTPQRREAAQQAVQRLATEGLRVLAVAERADGPAAGDEVTEDVVADLTLLGFVGVADTPRPDAADALRRITDDGIRMIMVTGDHPTTATAIARMVGMPADSVLTGADLDRMPEGERIRRVAETSVFARVTPEQKLRIVEALQAAGHVVAMTGDGTNDAAAIRLADVGIGVAASGSSAARTAADLVLADVDVGHIYEALLEGRALWHRVRDAVSILVGGNAGEVAFMVLGTALAGRAPIGVRQMLLVNMLTDMFPALAVAVAPSRNGDQREGSPAAALGGVLARAVAVRGGATAFGALLAWTIGRYTGRSRRASSIGLAALVGTQLAQTLLTGWHSPLVVATIAASAAALVAVIEMPGVSHFFGCTPIGPVAWGVVAISAVAGTLVAVVAQRLLPAPENA